MKTVLIVEDLELNRDLLAHIPVIVLSAHAMSGDEERARAAGCDDFLTKPIDEAALFEKLARHLGH